MGLKDLIVTPLFLILIYAFAYIFKSSLSNPTVRKQFIPALTVKILGGLGVGVVYQFYYSGGDTFNYFDHGSKYIWQAFMNNPIDGIVLLFSAGTHYPHLYEYSSQIWSYTDMASFFVVRIAAFFDIFTFHTYSSTALLFTVLSFSGAWKLYMTFVRFRPSYSREFAIAVFFVPSVFFWGSGILKDSLTFGALGWLVYALADIFFFRKKVIASVAIALVSAYVLYTIKIYILLCFLPAFIIWVSLDNIKKIKQTFPKFIFAPIIILIMMVLSYTAVLKVGEDNRRYSLGNLSKTAEITARWLNYVSTQEGGAAYTLGDFDYSAEGIAKKAIPAVWVTLFRPYLWEVNGAVMLFSSIESTFIFLFTIYVFIKVGITRFLKTAFNDAVIMFCFVFSISFAIAVGFSTYNFGSLVRYKIPLIPFYLVGMQLVLHQVTRHTLKSQKRTNIQ